MPIYTILEEVTTKRTWEILAQDEKEAMKNYYIVGNLIDEMDEGIHHCEIINIEGE